MLDMHREQNLGAWCIQSGLLWEENTRLPLAMIQEVLVDAEDGPKAPPRRKHCTQTTRSS